MYFFAIGIAILGAALLEASGLLDFDNTRPPYRMSQFRWTGYMVGGMLFGVGMTLCRGCGMKNMINLGSGNLKAVIAILGMGLAAVLLLYVEGVYNDYFLSWMMPLTPDLAEWQIEHQDLGSIAAAITNGDVRTLRLVIGLVLAAALIASLWFHLI